MSKKKTEGAVFSASQPAAANFAAEKRKKKHKPQDHLEYDVMQAEALGYGCHYGAYKADHPETRADFEADTGIVEIKKVEPSKVEKTCPYCGTAFFVGALRKNKIYCCDDCRKNAEIARKAVQPVTMTCLWCGQQITDTTNRTRYCCPECYCAARRDRNHKRRKGKEEAENGV